MDEKTMNEKTMTAFLRAVKVAAHELGYDVFCAVEGDGVGVEGASLTPIPSPNSSTI